MLTSQSLGGTYRNFTVVFLLSVFILLHIQCDVSVKIPPQDGDRWETFVGEQLINSLITVIVDVSFTRCKEECSISSRCLSVNYFRRFLLCELHYSSKIFGESTFVRESTSVYSEQRYPNEMINGTCSGRCKLNERCQEDIDGRKCVMSDCGDPPRVDNTIADLSNGIGIYSNYVCLGKQHTGCQPNGRWTPLNLTGYQYGLNFAYTTSGGKIRIEDWSGKVHVWKDSTPWTTFRYTFTASESGKPTISIWSMGELKAAVDDVTLTFGRC